MLRFTSSKFASSSNSYSLNFNLSIAIPPGPPFALAVFEIDFYLLRVRFYNLGLSLSPSPPLKSGLSSADFSTALKASKLLKRRSLILIRFETEPYVMLSSSMLVCEACDWMTETYDGL